MKTSAQAVAIRFLLTASLLSGCGGRAYVHNAYTPDELRGRAETQTEDKVQVSAAVPGRDETAAIFGLPLYDQGIQPVWIEITNSSSRQVRYTLSSTDQLYYSPFEIAWKNRGGYSDEARKNMERHLLDLEMPRHVPPGESRSGFVFTHADTGAKGFNVDVFGADTVHNFTYLLRVPGFTPDYADVKFASLYHTDDYTVYDQDKLPVALKALPCCAADTDGNETGEPINLVLVGKGTDLLKALLRSNWIETSTDETAKTKATWLFGRQQDAIFRYKSLYDDSYYELRAWLAPVMAGEDRVWAAQVRHFFQRGLPFIRIDPDVDNARNFSLQNFLYGQALEQYAWLSGREVVAPDSFWENLVAKAYFTDGYRVVMWLSPDPVSVLAVDSLDWEDPPGWKR